MPAKTNFITAMAKPKEILTKAEKKIFMKYATDVTKLAVHSEQKELDQVTFLEVHATYILADYNNGKSKTTTCCLRDGIGKCILHHMIEKTWKKLIDDALKKADNRFKDFSCSFPLDIESLSKPKTAIYSIMRAALHQMEFRQDFVVHLQPETVTQLMRYMLTTDQPSFCVFEALLFSMCLVNQLGYWMYWMKEFQQPELCSVMLHAGNLLLVAMGKRAIEKRANHPMSGQLLGGFYEEDAETLAAPLIVNQLVSLGADSREALHAVMMSLKVPTLRQLGTNLVVILGIILKVEGIILKPKTEPEKTTARCQAVGLGEAKIFFDVSSSKAMMKRRQMTMPGNGKVSFIFIATLFFLMLFFILRSRRKV